MFAPDVSIVQYNLKPFGSVITFAEEGGNKITQKVLDRFT